MDDRANGSPPEETIRLEVTDVLDLHTFHPSEVSSVVREYLDAAANRGLRYLRIIHGRGVGAQRRTVRTVLSRDERVVDFRDAPPEAGGWGATVVELGSGRDPSSNLRTAPPEFGEDSA